ncbi:MULTISPECIES: DUF378 domain-containing protein [Gracilibacillus]|uniref:DUF378 domain-containing protein n=1 Tax=Gracilibacillus TaxID=74385 RepID=UPI0008252CAE|nr:MULTISPECIES: DUF378 domain-containing protein [Gracilibacillus]
MKKLALILIIVGAINWGLIGLFQYDLVASLFGGGSQAGMISRIIYTIVGIAGLASIAFLFKNEQRQTA